MQKIKVGVIGCGGICKAEHIPAFLMIDEAEVVALCDNNIAKAEIAKKEFDLNSAIYEDYRELLSDKSIGLIHICTPNYLHSTIADGDHFR